jgi:hypothetical protein
VVPFPVLAATACGFAALRAPAPLRGRELFVLKAGGEVKLIVSTRQPRDAHWRVGRCLKMETEETSGATK